MGEKLVRIKVKSFSLPKHSKHRYEPKYRKKDS